MTVRPFLLLTLLAVAVKITGADEADLTSRSGGPALYIGQSCSLFPTASVDSLHYDVLVLKQDSFWGYPGMTVLRVAPWSKRIMSAGWFQEDGSPVPDFDTGVMHVILDSIRAKYGEPASVAIDTTFYRHLKGNNGPIDALPMSSRISMNYQWSWVHAGHMYHLDLQGGGFIDGVLCNVQIE